MRSVRKLFPAGAAVLLLLASTGCRHDEAEAAKPESTREEAPEIVFHARDTVEMITPDFSDSVREKNSMNPDAVAWLYIPDTTVSDVVLLNPREKTNDYYLNVNFYGEPDKNGTYCADLRSEFGSGSRRELLNLTTVYGHSWDDDPDGELFAQLKKFRDAGFARQHPYIFLSTAADQMAWEVFAVFDTHIDLPYIDPYLGGSSFYDMLDIALDASLHNYDITVGPNDRILTLSTCTFSVEGHEELPAFNDYRFVIMARLVDPDETRREQAEFVVNASPASPDEIWERVNDGAIRRYIFGVDT